MNADQRSSTRRPRTPKVADWPQRIRRGSPLVPYLVERDCPSRRPDWRWRLAESLIARKHKAPPPTIDPVFARVMRYQVALSLDESNVKRIAFEAKHPAIVCARQMFAEDGLRRWVLEARLLAGQTAEEIARIEGMNAETVIEYEAVFFDVVSRLGARHWVVGRAIGPRYLERMEAGEVGVILKAFAHFCGPTMLDHLLQVAVDPAGSLIPLDISQLNTAEQVTAAMARLTIMLLMGPANPKRLTELAGIRELIRDAGRRFSTETNTTEPVSVHSALAERRYDVDFERPGSISHTERAEFDVDLPLENGAGHQIGEAEQNRGVA